MDNNLCPCGTLIQNGLSIYLKCSDGQPCTHIYWCGETCSLRHNRDYHECKNYKANHTEE